MPTGTSEVPGALTTSTPTPLADGDLSRPAWGLPRLRLILGRGGPAQAIEASDATRPAGRGLVLVGGRALTAVGLLALVFVGYEFLLTGLLHDRMDTALLAAFRKAIPTTTLGSATAVPAEGSPIAILTIPRIGLQQAVVEGTSPDDLKSDPGHLRTSVLPGEFGNAVIAGRRTTYGGPFRQVDRLESGDQIKVATGQGSFIYVVSGTHGVAAGDVGSLAATRDTRLTLITSDPAFFASGRLVVEAKLTGAPAALPNRPSAPVDSGDLGLAGEPLGLALALLFGQLLAATIWLARRMRRRWPPNAVHLLATPVVIALAVLTFSNLDRVLPGTL